MKWVCTFSFRCDTVVSGRQISTNFSEVPAAFIMTSFIHRVVTGSKFFRYLGTHLKDYTASPHTSNFYFHYFDSFKSQDTIVAR